VSLKATVDNPWKLFMHFYSRIIRVAKMINL
jgi:hypothetical protein